MKIKHNIKTRLLAGTLALSMLFSLTPTPVFAADDGTVTESTVAEDTTEATTENDNLKENTEIVTEVTTETPTTEKTTEATTEKTTEKKTEVTTEANTEVSTEKEEVTTEKEAETTDKETTEKATEVTTEEKTEEETTEEATTEEVVVELVEFDHYFSTIDESLVNTSDLLVKTDDANVFTKNTNVVSNYDDVYIISCNSVEQARYTYSYYVDKVQSISDMSNIISMANEDDVEEDKADLSDINNGNDALSNLNDIDVSNYSNYIALIDSGANADVNYSVVGDNTSDTVGHGTKMLQYIKEENPNAKVMSIKVFDGNTTNAANVYAGIKLAIESNVKVINLSLVGANVEKNAIVKDVINEALANGITVIGAAGNYGVNAKNYISGCIDGVITVGAVNEDGTKLATSNYNADLYVVANSTSEATARYSGMFTANNTKNDRVFTKLVEPTEDDEDEQTDTQYDKIVA